MMSVATHKQRRHRAQRNAFGLNRDENDVVVDDDDDDVDIPQRLECLSNIKSYGFQYAYAVGLCASTQQHHWICSVVCKDFIFCVLCLECQRSSPSPSNFLVVSIYSFRAVGMNKWKTCQFRYLQQLIESMAVGIGARYDCSFSVVRWPVVDHLPGRHMFLLVGLDHIPIRRNTKLLRETSIRVACGCLFTTFRRTSI